MQLHYDPGTAAMVPHILLEEIGTIAAVPGS